jgi:deoxyguanosine kinase
MTSDPLSRLGYVVVEGPIGAGKTTLAKRLAEHLNGDTLLEAPEENPFLERFYKEGRTMALPTQLYFLFQRSKQFKALKQGDLFRPRIVADFMVQKDPLFARINLDEEELDLYRQVYDNITLEAPVPDLVIYLQAPVEVLLERIKKRDRPEERTIDADYLRQLCDAYADFFYYYDEAPLLIVNSTGINLAESKEDFQLLLQRIAVTSHGKHYFNPIPLSLNH